MPSSHRLPSRSFREDINGLRAFAILSVLAYHFGLPGMSGGFAGVDVFFVISGYLMTGIVVSRLQARKFTLREFYEDRLRRIVPALAVLLAAALACGAIFLVPAEFAILGKNVAMSALFASNLRFRTDYFGPDIDQEWLLHTWSLSVEWQFYLVFPVVVWIAWKLAGERFLLPIFAAGACLSLAISLWLTAHWPIAAFYLLPSRAWEMLAGGIVLLAPAVPARYSRLVQVAGFLLLAVTLFWVTDVHWPGIQAILPIAGTAAVIAARRTDSRITGNPIAHWIGVNSYSIYLWHWPVALLVLREAPGNLMWSAIGVVVSLALGHLSYRFVESRALRKRADGVPATPRRRMAWAGGLVAALFAIALLGRQASSSDGWVSRYPPAVAQVARDAFAAPDYPEGCFSVLGDVPRRCVIGQGQLALTLVGDSHAASAFGGVARAMSAIPGRSIGFNAYASCPPLLGVSSLDPQSRCEEFSAAHVAPLARHRTEPVLLVADWQSYLDKPVVSFAGESSARRFASEVRHTACALARGGPTFMALPVPGFRWRVPYRLQEALVSGGLPAADRLGVRLSQYHRSQGKAIAVVREAARACGVGIIDPAQLLCKDGFCRASMRGRPLYYDRHHLTVFGSRETSPVYAPVVNAARVAIAGAGSSR